MAAEKHAGEGRHAVAAEKHAGEGRHAVAAEKHAGAGKHAGVPYGTIFAASVVAVVPIGILVFIFRKNIIPGLTSGTVRG